MALTRLTWRQHRFVEAFKRGANLKDAAIEAGFSKGSAASMGSLLGNHPKVLAAIAGTLPPELQFDPQSLERKRVRREKRCRLVEIAAKKRDQEAAEQPKPAPAVEAPTEAVVKEALASGLSRDWIIERLMQIVEDSSGKIVPKEKLQALNQLRVFLGPMNAGVGRPKKEVVEKAAPIPPPQPSGGLANLFRPGAIQAKH